MQTSLRIGAAKAAHRFTSEYSILDTKRLQQSFWESADCNRDGGLGLVVGDVVSECILAQFRMQNSKPIPSCGCLLAYNHFLLELRIEELKE